MTAHTRSSILAKIFTDVKHTLLTPYAVEHGCLELGLELHAEKLKIIGVKTRGMANTVRFVIEDITTYAGWNMSIRYNAVCKALIITVDEV